MADKAEMSDKTVEAASAKFDYRIVSGGFWCCGQDFFGEKNEDLQEFSKTAHVLTIGYRTFR